MFSTKYYKDLTSFQNGNHVTGLVFCWLFPHHYWSDDIVLNPKTDHVSPQYNVVFDDTSITVTYMRDVMVPINCKTVVDQGLSLTTPDIFDSYVSFNQYGPDNGDDTTILKSNWNTGFQRRRKQQHIHHYSTQYHSNLRSQGINRGN